MKNKEIDVSEEKAKEEMDKMMLMPRNFKTLLCIGMNNEGGIFYLKKMDEPKLMSQAVATAFHQDPAFMNAMGSVIAHVREELQKEQKQS